MVTVGLPNTYASYDLLELGFLTYEQIARARLCALSLARPAVLAGGSSTSLEPDSTRVHYRLITGDTIAGALPWLDHLYRNTCSILATLTCRTRMVPAGDTRIGVNINVLEGVGARYEWHVDSNQLTGVLYFTDSDERTGGRLVFGLPAGEQTYVPVRAGTLLLFDARNSAHCVESLRLDCERISAPMNFFVVGEPIVRPSDLDHYLYEGSGGSAAQTSGQVDA